MFLQQNSSIWFSLGPWPIKPHVIGQQSIVGYRSYIMKCAINSIRYCSASPTSFVPLLHKWILQTGHDCRLKDCSWVGFTFFSLQSYVTIAWTVVRRGEGSRKFNSMASPYLVNCVFFSDRALLSICIEQSITLVMAWVAWGFPRLLIMPLEVIHSYYLYHFIWWWEIPN